MSYLRILDTKIQHRVDALVLWLIDRGIPKYLTVYILALTGMGAMLTKSGVKGKTSDIIVTGLFCMVIGYFIECDRQESERAEQRNMLSAADVRHQQVVANPFWKGFNVVCLLIFPWSNPTTLAAALSAISWACWSLDCWVAHAPRRPPQARDPKPIHVPARATG